MAWSTVRTWVAGEIVTAALLNTHLRDQLRFLHGDDGVATILSGITLDNTDGDEYFKLPNHTTTETGSVLSASTDTAKILYDGTASRLKYRDIGSIQSVINISDIDDTPVDGASTAPISSNWAYDFQNVLTSAGDIPYASAGGAWTRLGKGTVGQFLTMNTASLPAWGAVAANSKLLTFSRNLGASAPATATYGGYGFTPNSLQFISPGVADAAYAAVGNYSSQSTWTIFTATTQNFSSVYVIGACSGGVVGIGQNASILSLDSDGFTLTWSKPTATIGATLNFGVMAWG